MRNIVTRNEVMISRSGAHTAVPRIRNRPENPASAISDKQEECNMGQPNVPELLMETSNGYSSCRMQDELLKQRTILCFGEITPDLANGLVLQLLYLGRQSEEKITMYIHSPGGEVTSGFAIYDTMQLIKSPIRTVCMGRASSMAAVLFAAGSSRLILEHSEVMIHDPLVQQLSGNTLKIKDWADSLLEARNDIVQILSRHTGRTVEEILEKTERETTFNAKEAVKFGLADKILRGSASTASLSEPPF